MEHHYSYCASWLIFALNASLSFGWTIQPQKSFGIGLPCAICESGVKQLSALPGSVSGSISSSIVVFDDDLWESYMQLVPKIVDSRRVLSGTKCETKPVVDYLTRREIFGSKGTTEASQGELREKRKLFRETEDFDSNQMEYLLRCFAYIGDHCAKKQTASPALVAWCKLLETGIVPRERLISTYLYVLSHSDTPDAETVIGVATFHDLLYSPNEKTAFLRIKFLLLQGEKQAARDLLFQTTGDSSSAWQKLRTFLPLLERYLFDNEPSAALDLFGKMRASPGVTMDADAYALLLSKLILLECFNRKAPNIDGWPTGPRLLDELLGFMADDLLELSPEAAGSVYDALRLTFDEKIESTAFNFVQVGEEIAFGRVAVDPSSAKCMKTGAQLRLFALTSSQRQHVHDTLLNMAFSQHEEFHIKMKARKRSFKDMGTADEAAQRLGEFSQWLCDQPEPFTAIIDGANVAYADHGNVHYSQIQLMIEKLEALGENPLVVMPSKYVTKKFFLAGIGRTQTLSAREEDLMNSLLESKKMYEVPPSCLDDYYWMIASVADPRAFRTVVKTDDADERYPGLRPMLITNDQMRDHKLALLEPRLFRRWSSCHIVNYSLDPYVDDEWADRGVTLVPADFFSREIQGNEASGLATGMAWHIPITSWDQNDRFCINIQEGQ